MSAPVAIAVIGAGSIGVQLGGRVRPRRPPGRAVRPRSGATVGRRRRARRAARGLARRRAARRAARRVAARVTVAAELADARRRAPPTSRSARPSRSSSSATLFAELDGLAGAGGDARELLLGAHDLAAARPSCRAAPAASSPIPPTRRTCCRSSSWCRRRSPTRRWSTRTWALLAAAGMSPVRVSRRARGLRLQPPAGGGAARGLLPRARRRHQRR